MYNGQNLNFATHLIWEEVTQMAKAEDRTSAAPKGARYRERTNPDDLKAHAGNRNLNAPATLLSSLQSFVLFALVVVWCMHTSSLLAQELPFSASQAYRDMLTNLGEKVVHPSRMSAGGLLKGPLPAVPVEQVETNEGVAVESNLWRLEVSKNPWKLSLLNKATQAVWKIASDASGPSGIWWSNDPAGSGPPLQLSRVEKVQRTGNHWAIDCRVEGTDKGVTLGLDIISPNVIRLSIEAPSWGGNARLGISIAGQGPFFGLGERYEKAKLDGLKVKLHIEDNYDSSITPGHNWTYVPVPFLLNPRGLGLYVDTARISTFDLTSEASQRFSVQINGPSTDCYFLVAEGPKGVITAYTSLTGRTPLSPPWALGVWVCALKGRDVVVDVARRLRQQGIPASAIYPMDLYDMPGNMVAPQGLAPYYGPPREFVEALHELGFKVLWYKTPYVLPILTPYFSPNPDFEEGVRKHFFVLTPDGEPIGPDYPSMTFVAGSRQGVAADLDFTAPAAVDRWQKWIQVSLKDYDFDGFMEDYGEYVNEDYQFAFGKNAGRDMANLYSLFYHKITFLMVDQLKPGAVTFARSGYAGSQGYTRALSAGDQVANWTVERGLPSAVPAGITAGLSGFAVWGPDIDCTGSSKELYARWTEFGALTPIMRTLIWSGRGLEDLAKYPIDIWFDSQTIDLFRKYAKLHTSLFPYFYTYATEAAKDGLPIIRHPMLEWPDDPQTYDAEYQYLLGDRILVAPVLKEGARTRSLYLPKGSWVDYWTGNILEGGHQVEVQAPLERIPIFVKAGSIIPMINPETETLAQDLADSKYRTIGNSLIWRVFGSESLGGEKFVLYDGTQVTVDRQAGQLRINEAQSPVIRGYEVILPAAKAPTSVELSGRRLSTLDDGGYRAGKEGWWLSANDGMLHVLFTSDNFSLTIREH